MERQTLAQIVAQQISDYLGPAFPRPNARNGSALNPGATTGKIATLKALRDNIDLSPNTALLKRDLLVWQLREAIRTEFFQIHYPRPPTPKLLRLVTTTEGVLSDLEASQRPIYFPGARVAVPTEVGTHRAATTLQLRFKPHQQKTITEVLLHLDGPSGGSFQWVPSKILMLLSSCVPIPNPAHASDRTQTQKGLASRTTSAASRRKSASTPVSGAVGPNGNSRTSRIRSRKSESRLNSRAQPTTSLPASFLPRALRSTSPPPKKRLRSDFQTPISSTTGAIRRTLNAWSYCSEMGGSKIPVHVQNSILENTLCIQSLIGRRRNASLGGIIQYCVKWSGAPVAAASWESRDALMRDVPGLVLAFDTSHPEEPAICNVVQNEAPNKETSGAGGKTKEVIDSTTNFPIPEYLDTPVLELNFSGMQLQLRRGSKAVFFLDDNEAKMDRKKKLARFKSENPSGWEKVFLNNSIKFLEEPKMEVKPTSLKINNPDVLPVLQKSIDSHSANKRRPISYPKGLGQVKSRDDAAIIPMEDILNSPDSWESYLVSLGLECRDWHRSLLPHMPGVGEETVRYMSSVAEMRWEEDMKLKNERDRKCRVDIEEYIAKPRRAGWNSSPKKETRSVKSAENEDIVDQSIIEAAKAACAHLS